MKNIYHLLEIKKIPQKHFKKQQMKMKNIIIFIILVAINISCKDNNQQKNLNSDSVLAKDTVQNIILPDTLKKQHITNKIEQNIQQINLPFDFEEMSKICASDENVCLNQYPVLINAKLLEVKKIISESTEDSPDKIFQINNGGLVFDTYVYCTYGDSDSQTLINIKDDKIIASESIGYAMPENKTYQSFVIDKDLSVTIYDIEYNNFLKKTLEKYKIKNDGKIVKM
jgi:hypothetical protein